MKKKFGIILAIGLVFSAVISTKAGAITCDHPTSAVNHSTVSDWYTEHTIIVSYNPTVTKTCYVRHWVERITSYCPTCNYVFGYQDLNHETHSLCGGSF